jgi:hypothetical protein
LVDAVKLTGAVYIDKGKCGKPLTSTMYSEPDEFPVLVETATDARDQPAYVKIQMVPEPHYDDFRVLPEG